MTRSLSFSLGSRASISISSTQIQSYKKQLSKQSFLSTEPHICIRCLMIFSWQDGDDSGMNRFGSGLNRLGSLQLHRHPHNRPWMYQASDLAVHGSSLAVDDKESFISGSHHVVAEDPRCCYRAVRVFPLRQRRLHSFPNTGHHFYFAWRQNTKD